MHEKLASWNVHTNLGKTVFEISQKLIQDQPQVLGGAPIKYYFGFSFIYLEIECDFIFVLYVNVLFSTYGGSYPNTGEPPPPYGLYANTPATNTPNNGPPARPPSSSSPTPPQQIRTPAIPSSFPELEQKSYVNHYLITVLVYAHFCREELQSSMNCYKVKIHSKHCLIPWKW